MSPARRFGSLAVALLCSSPLEVIFAQQYPTRYEAQFGTPVDVSLNDLVQNGLAYDGRAVRTKGRMDLESQMSTGSGRRLYLLRDMFTEAVLIYPMPEVAGNFESEAMTFMGSELEVTGVFNANRQAAGAPVAGTMLGGSIAFWEYVGPPQKPAKGVIDAKLVSLESLVSKAGSRDGATVKAVGKFRGRNLYGDLPVSSQRSNSDWVIKDDVYAVWVSGKKPKGDGWELDASLKRDTGKWIEVIGRVETRAGVTYLRAVHVGLTSPPTPTAQAQPPPPPPEKPKLPPVVVFALPLDGESDVPSNSRFVLQFSKDMNEESFKGNVLLRYAGPLLPGDRGFDGVKLSYDGGRRALTVDPGDLLRTGRRVELLLLPGILDLDGLALTPRPGRQFEEAVDVLRFEIGG
jgi:hypothetical protein